MSNDGGIDGIRLRPLAESLSEGAHLRRIDHHDRQLRRCQASRNHCLKTAGSFDRDDARSKSLQSLRQSLDPGAIAINDKTFATRANAYIQTILGNVDADHGGVHLIPSLRKRARCAAQATVRVRWNGGRRPMLTHGLGVPQGLRSSARHRTGHLSRCSDSRLTRGPLRDSERPGSSCGVTDSRAILSPAERPPHPDLLPAQRGEGGGCAARMVMFRGITI